MVANLAISINIVNLGWIPSLHNSFYPAYQSQPLSKIERVCFSDGSFRRQFYLHSLVLEIQLESTETSQIFCVEWKNWIKINQIWLPWPFGWSFLSSHRSYVDDHFFSKDLYGWDQHWMKRSWILIDRSHFVQNAKESVADRFVHLNKKLCSCFTKTFKCG